MGMEVVFLSIDDVLVIHRDQISRYGGSAEVRDLDLLASAVQMPQATFGGAFLHADLLEMAAAYLFHIVRNHPFIDGNKRTGTAAALVFLDLNGVEIDIPDDQLVEHVLEAAQGRMGKLEIAAFLKQHKLGR